MDIVWGSLVDPCSILIPAFLSTSPFGGWAHMNMKAQDTKNCHPEDKGRSSLRGSSYLFQLLPWEALPQSWLAASGGSPSNQDMEELPGETHRVPRIKPLQCGVTSFLNNERPCRSCNLGRGKRGPWQWYWLPFDLIYRARVADLSWRFGHGALLCCGTLCTYYSQSVHLRTNAKD